MYRFDDQLTPALQNPVYEETDLAIPVRSLTYRYTSLFFACDAYVHIQSLYSRTEATDNDYCEVNFKNVVEVCLE